MDFIVPLILGSLTAVWRFYDGGNKPHIRSQSVFARVFLQTTTPFALVLIAGLWAAWSTTGLSARLPILLPVLVAGWLLIRGMPGFEFWLPHWSDHKKARRLYRLTRRPDSSPLDLSAYQIVLSGCRWREGMLIGFALPTYLAGFVFASVTHEYLAALPFAFSGLLIAVTYVELSSIEFHRGSLSGPFTAEEWGRISCGSIVFGLALL